MKSLNLKKLQIGLGKTLSDSMVRDHVIRTAKDVIKKRGELFRKLAEEHKYLKK